VTTQAKPRRTPKAKPPEKTSSREEMPILDFQTEAPERTPVRIDGEPYEIREMGEYGIGDQHEINAKQASFDRLWETEPDHLKKGDGDRMKVLLDFLVRKALDAPPEIIDKLNAEQRKEIVRLFIGAPLQTLRKVAAQLVERAETEARTGSTSES
jgi:hypothetical protein